MTTAPAPKKMSASYTISTSVYAVANDVRVVPTLQYLKAYAPRHGLGFRYLDMVVCFSWFYPSQDVETERHTITSMNCIGNIQRQNDNPMAPAHGLYPQSKLRGFSPTR